MTTPQTPRRRIWPVLLAVCIVCLVGAGIYWGRRPSLSGQESRRAAPEFSLKDPVGKTHALGDWSGDAVVLHFWASWCPPCLGEIPQWVALARDYSGKPIRFVAVSLDQNWKDALKVLPATEVSGQLESLIDPELKIPETYGTYQYPETYLIDRKHRILTKLVGPQEWDNPMVRKLIDKILE
ncbi:MAG: TlpA family protein disulfide reductase [Bdellovibrionota bacterium]